MKFEKTILIIGIVLCCTVSCALMHDVTFIPRWLTLSVVTLALSLSLIGKRIMLSNELSTSLSVPINFVTLSFGLYLAAAALSLLRAYNVGEGLFEVCKITLLFCFLIVVYSTIKDIGNIAPYVATLTYLLGLYGLYRIFSTGSSGYFATMANKNIWAQANLLLLPFCLYLFFRKAGVWRVIGGFASFLAITNIALSQVRSAILGLVISIAVVAVIKGHAFFVSCLCLCLLAVAIISINNGLEVINSDSLKERLCVWRQTVNLIKDKFWVGAGNWQLEIPNYARGFRQNKAFETEFTVRPHNDYLWVASELSPVGLVFYLSIFGFSIFYARHNPYILMGLISYMVIAFFSFPKERAALSMILIIYIALASSQSTSVSWVDRVMSCVIPVCVILIMFIFAARARAECDSKVIRLAYANKDWPAVLKLSDKLRLPSYIDLYGTPTCYYTALAYDQLGDYRNALITYAKAGLAHANHLYILSGLGLCYYTFGDYDKAEFCYKKALIIKPDYVGLQQNLQAIKKQRLAM